MDKPLLQRPWLQVFGNLLLLENSILVVFLKILLLIAGVQKMQRSIAGRFSRYRVLALTSGACCLLVSGTRVESHKKALRIAGAAVERIGSADPSAYLQRVRMLTRASVMFQRWRVSYGIWYRHLNFIRVESRPRELRSVGDVSVIRVFVLRGTVLM
jgi:hypothetical protein